MAAPAPTFLFTEDLGTEVVHIFVGSEEKHYVVHKQLLTSSADYFKKTFDGGFKEAKEMSIHMDEDDPAAVGLLVGWLYRGTIPSIKDLPNVDPVRHNPLPTKSELPKSKGTISPFMPVRSKELFSQLNENLQNVCFQTENYAFSQEELRLADYHAGNTTCTDQSSVTSNSSYSTNDQAPGVSASTPESPPDLSRPLFFGDSSPPCIRCSAPQPPKQAQALPSSSIPGSSSSFNAPPIARHIGLFGRLSNEALAQSQDITTHASQPLWPPTPQGFQASGFGGPSNGLHSDPNQPRFYSKLPAKPPFDQAIVHTEATLAHQTALLHLLLLSEKLCWPQLFNATLAPYVDGEMLLSRSLPTSHASLVYERTHPASTLRLMVLDRISHLGKSDDYLLYVPLAQENEDFLEDLLQRVAEGGRFLSLSLRDLMFQERYHMMVMGEK